MQRRRADEGVGDQQPGRPPVVPRRVEIADAGRREARQPVGCVGEKIADPIGRIGVRAERRNIGVTNAGDLGGEVRKRRARSQRDRRKHDIGFAAIGERPCAEFGVPGRIGILDRRPEIEGRAPGVAAADILRQDADLVEGGQRRRRQGQVEEIDRVAPVQRLIGADLLAGTK